MTLRKILSLLIAMIMALGCVGIPAMAEETAAVAKVGDTEYATIDEAIAAWTNGTTLTLLSDVTLSDVIKLSSTEYHVLDLGTYTMTAASGKDAIQYVVNGRSSASYALDIKADATNPGGITATGKTVVSHIKPSSDAPSKDRPITRFYGGIFNASYVVKQGGTSSWGFLTSGYTGASAPYFQFYGGEYNGTIYTNRSQNQFYGGTFNGSMQMSVDSSAYTLVAGGTFKNLSNSMGSTLNSDKFVIGTAKGANDGSVCVDENGYYVISTTTPTEAEASVASNYNSNNYFYYSTVNTNGMYYEDVYDAIESNNTGVVTVFADELDLSDTTFEGTIVVPEGEEITIIVEEGVTPTWTVDAGEDAVTYTDNTGNVLEKDESGSFVDPDSSETSEDVIVEGVDVEIIPVEGEDNSYDINLAEGATWTEGTSVTMTFPAVEGASDGDSAYVVHEHEDGTYIYVGKVENGSVTIENTTGFSTFTVYEGGFDDALAEANTCTDDITVEIYGKVEYTDATPNLTGAYNTINFVGKTDDAEISITRNGSNGYICGNANGTPDVTFSDLILSKPAGSFAGDAGFMNVYFTVYRAGTVTYTNCTFPDGACAAGSTVTYTDCTFANQTSGEYSLWVYANADVTVDGGSFTGVRGVKMYTESNTVDDAGTLSLEGVTFTDSVTQKPAIVLTYGESVTLENNTYSSTGVFELDLDGAPNGTTVTSDVAPTCKNDNGACGVLVDGKIYTTVEEAVAVAEAGDTVTLLYSTDETATFAEGVILTLADGVEAENVSVAESAVPEKGYMLYIYNADGTVGMEINGTNSVDETYSLKSAIADARTFVDNAFLFGITTPATYVVEMYEDSTEDESFEIGSDVTINGNGHNIVCAEGVEVTNNGTLNDATIVATPATAITTISTVEDLIAFANAVNSGNDYTGKTVTLTDDLILTDAWTSIGNGSRSGSSYTGNSFAGTFDGGNHTISGLTAPLFGIVTGTVKDVNLVADINDTTNDSVGAAVAILVGGTVDDVDVSGTVTATKAAGGVVGRVLAIGEVKNCDNTAAVTSTGSSDAAGGIVGKAYYTSTSGVMNITDCTNTGAINGGYAAGGIVGFSAANVSNCTNSGTVTSTGCEAGGIVGEQTNYGTISGNENSADVTGGIAGGIVGWVRYQNNSSAYPLTETVVITNNTNTGSIASSTDLNALSCAGGIVGNIYNQATVTGNTNEAETISAGVFAAGIVGALQPSTDNVDIEGATFTVTGNTTTTTAENITANCTDLVAYNNVASDATIEDNTVPSDVAYAAYIGDTGYESVAAALAAAKEDGTTNLVITITGVNDASTEDTFDLSYGTAFESVTIKQDNGGTAYYIAGIYTGDRTVSGGQFVFDGVNIISTSNIWFECDVVLKNNSVLTRPDDSKNFVYYGSLTIEPGSKFVSQIDDVMAGSLTVDGGKTDGTYSTEPDYKSIYVDVREGQTLTLQNGAYALFNAANEIGRLTLNGNVVVTDSKLEVFNNIVMGDNSSIKVNGASQIVAKVITGSGVITIDASGMTAGASPIDSDVSGFTGTVEVVNNNGLVADIVDGKIVLSAKPAPTGTVTPAYTSATTIWGEATGNASESFAIKLYSDDTLLVTATLNDPEGAIIDGNIENVTWNIPLNNAGTDSWWTVEWTKYITAATQPTKVVAVVDGVEVAENTYKLNSPDDLNKIYAAVADADGKFTAYYTDVQEAIVAAAPAGTVEILSDVTVDEWVMIAESLTIGNDDLITCVIDGLTINGNNHTLTINSIESAGNGGRMFFDATNLNINNLNIVLNNGTNGIGLQSGTLSNVSFVGGGYGVLPQDGNITITGCTFETNSTAIYYEEERDNLVVTECTFNQPDDVNVILLRGDTTFTNNTVNSGRTVNVVSGSPVVSGNDFNNVRLKVYTAAEATISENEINVLAFEDGATTQNSAFSNNTMSTEAQAALEAMTPSVAASGEVAYRAYIEDSESREAIKVDLQNVYATSSVVVKLYDAEGNLLITTTLKAGGKEAEYLTTNIVLSGTASSSWDTVINAEKLTVANVPTKVELWIDGSLLDTFEPALGNATDAAPYQLPAYLALDSVYKEAKIGDTYYATLAEAFAAATEGCTITLLDNITVSEAWDCRYNGAKFTVPVTIDGNGKTLKLTGAVEDKNWNTVFRFEADATVKNLTIDASEASGIVRGISAKFDITVENSTFIGNGTTAKRAIIYGEGAGTAESEVTATISGCTFKDWSYGVSDSQSGKDSKSVSITDSTFTNASVLVSAAETVTFTGNTVEDGYVNITSYTAADTVSVTATENNLEGTDDVIQVNPENITADDSFITPIAKIGSKYYETLSKAVKKAKEGDTVQLLAGTISEGTIKLPATLKNVTIKGADNKATTLKDTTIMAADGDSLEYDGLTFDGIIFDNSNIIMTGWRTSASFKNITVTNCEFKNYSNDKNNAAVHLNIADSEAAENLVFTNNTVEGLSGSQVAALYATTAGETTITGNIVKNVQGNGFTVHVAGGTTTIKENTIENWANGADQGRAMRITFATGAEDASAVVNDNVMIKENAPEEFVKITGIESNSVNIDKNYWNGFSPVDEGIINVEGYTVGEEVSNYYSDVALTNLVQLNELFEFYGASPILGNSLAIDFAIDKSNFDGEGYYAEIEHDTANGVVKTTIPMDSWTTNGGYYVINYSNITAKQIVETMYITIYDENGNQVSERREDGVKAYAERMLAKANTSDKLKTTLVDLLNYGAAAQKQFAYRTDMLANASLTDEQKTYASEMPDIADEREYETAKCAGSSLVLKDNIRLEVAFAGITEGMTATATYTKHNATEAKTYEFTYDDFTTNGSYKVLTVDTLVIADAKQLVTITVYNKDGSVYTTYKDSMNSYLARQLEKGEAASGIYGMTAKFTASAYKTLH